MNTVTCAPRNRRRHTNATYYQHTPRVNVLKSDDGFTIEMAIPGVNKAEIAIETGEKHLTISHTTNSADDKKYVKKGFDLSGFKRRFQLPRNIDRAKIAAQFDAGILTLQLPLAEAAKPRTITIQ